MSPDEVVDSTTSSRPVALVDVLRFGLVAVPSVSRLAVKGPPESTDHVEPDNQS